jgi:ABC-type multidrug transport system ATPase subunit
MNRVYEAIQKLRKLDATIITTTHE